MTLRALVRPLIRAAIHFHEDGCLNHAAAVAFYSLLSLGPFLYLVSASLGSVFHDSAAPRAILESLTGMFPPESHNWFELIELKPPRQGPLFLIAIPALLWVAASAFIEFEYTLNVAFGRSRTGGSVIPRLKGFALLGAGWLLLGAGLIYSTLLPRLGSLRAAMGLPPTPDRLTAVVSSLSVAALSFLLFLAFYRILTRGDVSWSAAAKGALLALVLWEGSRELFGTVLAQSKAFGLWSGALAGMVAFLLWIYVSVAIVLMGAELAAVLNGNREDQEPVRVTP